MSPQDFRAMGEGSLFMKPRWLAAYSVACIALFQTPLIVAEEERAAPLVARLLDLGWGTTTAYRNAADAQVEAMFSSAGRQPLSLYAAALVQIKQRRYAEAIKLIDEVLERDE